VGDVAGFLSAVLGAGSTVSASGAIGAATPAILSLPAAVYGLIGVVVGALLTLLGTWIKLRADRGALERKFVEDRSALERQLAADKETLELRHAGELELARRSAALELEKLRLESEATLRAAKEQASLDVQKARQIAEEEADRDLKRRNNAIQLAVSDSLAQMVGALREMENAIALLCRAAREDRTITFPQSPVRFLEVTYGLHYPVARFRVLYEKYDHRKDEPLRNDPLVWNLWQVAIAIERTFTADNALADARPRCDYDGELPQDLNPEAFLELMVVPDAKKDRLVILRDATFRKQLRNKTLNEDALSDARRVIEVFSPRATAVFWRILLAQLLLCDLFRLVASKLFLGDYEALKIDLARFNAFPDGEDAGDALLGDLAAARSYVQEAVSETFRVVV
jgi:hypothetical protein